MNLKDFVKNVLVDINSAVDEARGTTTREITFSEKDNARTVEFDIAVSAEETDQKSGKAGIKVLQFAEAGGNLSQESKNSTVSRIVFGLRISPSTKAEQATTRAAIKAQNGSVGSRWPNQF